MKTIRLSLVSFLVGFAALAHAQTPGTDSPLQQAVRWDDTGAVITDLNTTPALLDQKNDDGWTPLATAAFSGKAKAARILIERGATVDVSDDDGERPLSQRTRNHCANAARAWSESGCAECHGRNAALSGRIERKSGSR